MGKKRINIAFKRYDLNYKNYQYCVLIPEHIDQLWVTSAGTPHWGVSFTANMDGLRALMYSFALLGFNPYNKIVYFPLRKNVIPRYYDLPKAFPGESPTEVVGCENGEIRLNPLYYFEELGESSEGNVVGKLQKKGGLLHEGKLKAAGLS